MAIIYGISIIDEIFGPALLTDAFEKIGISYDSVMTVSWIVTGLILAFLFRLRYLAKKTRNRKKMKKQKIMKKRKNN